MSSEASGEYDDELVGLLELVWGDGFLAPGGTTSVKRTVGSIDVADASVLDIGSGIGGADLVLAGELGAKVVGLEPEAALVLRAQARAAAGEVDVEYVVGGQDGLPFPDGHFDHVFSHAAIIHVLDKRDLFSDIMRVLRPGGWLLAYDWLRGPDPYTREMHYWFELEGLAYSMDHLANTLSMLESVGFEKVTGEDDTASYRTVATEEYARMTGEWHARMTELLGPDRRDHFIEGWRMLTVVLDQGQLRPAYYRAQKPF